MKNETLKQIINQIKKYSLLESFTDIESFDNWASHLNSTQINNFLSLDIELEEIKDLRHLLINKDLLNCKDYKKRVEAISTIKNTEGCVHLADAMFKPNFIKSKNFYTDLEKLSKADTARYGLWILSDDVFIHSPYHDEDLKLLVETHDTKEENPLDFVVSDAIATVASNKASIKSPYHQTDMELIATSGSDCLQVSHSYPETSLNNLAVNEVSLSDKYHLENMKILATNPIAREFLYNIMTKSEMIKGKCYREEINALVNAKSKLTARALYYYIANPRKKFSYDCDFYKDFNYDISRTYIQNTECVSGKNDPDYLNNLKLLNEIDDHYVMYYVSLLMNPNFINSSYKKFDLELLRMVSNKKIFEDLYYLMSNEISLKGIHHKKDAIIISQSIFDGVRDLLLQKACNEYSLKTSNHEYDMEFISKLDLDSISEKIYDELYYYLFKEKGMNDPQRKEKMEKLIQGIFVERSSSVSGYLDSLEMQLDNNQCNQIIKTEPIVKSKIKSKILQLFKK